MDRDDLLSEYNKYIDEKVDEAYEIADDAKKRREDPLPKVEIDLADDIAERSEKLLGIEGLAEEMRKLEDKDYTREEITFEITNKICEGEIGEFEDKASKIEGAVRSSVAILTEGIVAAPIDGIGEIELSKNDDGTQFVKIPYFGPIRSAGGTGQALSVLVADYARQLLDISEYKSRHDEIERYVEELRLYDSETSLQYLPPGDDIRTIVRNTPIMLDGEQTTDNEVDGYRDLERIEGNRARGGMCLVVGEGMGLKAPKIKKYTKKIDELEGWDWIDELIEESDEDQESDEELENKIKKEEIENHDKFKEEYPPHKKYLDDALFGRPLLSEPNTKGGFRLRYGRARNTGLASWGLNPATMYILKELVAIGTQLKTEQPGKAAGVSPVTSIEGPTIRTKTGKMKRIDTEEEAKKYKNNIDKIIDLGEIAVPFGEYLENNHHLMPSSYVHEWWIKEDGAPSNIDVEKLRWKQAYNLSKKKEIPLHPKYTYLYHDITTEQLEKLTKEYRYKNEKGTLEESKENIKIIERLLIPNKIEEDKIIIEETNHAECLKESLPKKVDHEKTVIQNVSEELGIEVKPRALTRIGARMGRPEKSKRREMDPPVHALYPIGRKGGNTRDLQKASKNTENNNQNINDTTQQANTKQGKVETQISTRECLYCNKKTWRIRCPECEKRTYPHYQCPECEKPGEKGEECKRCNREYINYKRQELSIKDSLKEASEKLSVNPEMMDTIKAVKGLTSKSKIPEPLEKGILRTKNGIQTFRDGTSRYDMVDLPLTSFKPKEVKISIEKLKDLGYTHDKKGEPLQDEDQLLELFPQDIILNEDCGDYLYNVANYIDDLLEKYYDEEPYYKAKSKKDLIGELVIGLAPHTSGGLVGRIIGYTPAKTNYASPLYHAGKRRNADGDEDSVMLLMDGFLNFSQKYLPDMRGKRSVSEDQKVFVKEKDKYKSVEIGDLVDRYVKNKKVKYRPDDFEVVRDFEEEIKVISFDPDDYSVNYSDVSALIRHPVDKDMYELEVEKGSIKVTEDHSVFSFVSGEVVECKVSDLCVGDEIIIPSNIDIENGSGFDQLDEVVDFNDKKSIKGSLTTKKIVDLEIIDYDEEYVYDLEVPNRQNFLCGPYPIFAHNTMDAPLVLTTLLDPEEVDDEAYNVETVNSFSKDFYEDSMKLKHPDEVDVDIKEDNLSHGLGFDSVIETDSIHAGPDENYYKKAGGMEEKTWEHMLLEEKLRCVDESLVAEMIITEHLLPDLMGNLSSFCSQETRCAKCNTKYRRVPLDGNCGVCGNDLILTIHEGSVKKYIDIMQEIIEKYDVSNYTDERVKILKDKVDDIFENDKVTQSGLKDFM